MHLVPLLAKYLISISYALACQQEECYGCHGTNVWCSRLNTSSSNLSSWLPKKVTKLTLASPIEKIIKENDFSGLGKFSG